MPVVSTTGQTLLAWGSGQPIPTRVLEPRRMPSSGNKTLGLLAQIQRLAEASLPPQSLVDSARQAKKLAESAGANFKNPFLSVFSELEELRRRQDELERIVLGPIEDLRQAFSLIQAEARNAARLAKTSREIEELRVSILGKTGLLNASKFLKQVPKEEAVEKGKVLSENRITFGEFLEQQAKERAQLELDQRLATERVDVTLPGRRAQIGGVHPLTRALDRMIDIFARFGYDVAEGPEIEDDWHNFEALNFPPDHPARAMHDTFYFGDGRLLRTHTSPVQVRAMHGRQPPIRLIAPGKVYRSDSDQTHSPMFHQVEGLLVGESVTMADLKGTLSAFLKAFFERDFEMRFKPTYFPFVEPGADVVIRWQLPDGSSRWLEVLGCGMVHPKVLENCSIDPERYTGFAFGMGVERLAMLRYGVTDLRAFFENDVRFLRQFA